jgi:N-acyl-D-amino-acid deacylase
MGPDLVIRGGTVVDGTRRDPFVADVVVRSGTIVAVEPGIAAPGCRQIDADGLVVTPGFVDVHTHYDGQAIWSPHLSPSSQHGVTTVVIGNCGVGFAPCAPADHDLLIDAMEGVEDIPELVMTEGLPWDWETFPEFLDAVHRRRHDIDVAAFVPHSPVRVYVMGERGANREPATGDDITRMASLVRDSMTAGAVGFSTSRSVLHRRGDGGHIPSYQADEAELVGLSAALDGDGVVQLVADLNAREHDEDLREEVSLLERLSLASGTTVSFAHSQSNRVPLRFDTVTSLVEQANRAPGVTLRPQFAPRPLGVHVGHSLSLNPFSANPTYRALADLPLPALVARLRTPEVRRQILGESPDAAAPPVMRLLQQFDKTFPVTDPPSYEPPAETSVAAQAVARRVPASELLYDLLLEQDGHAMLYVALSNYARDNLDHVADMFRRSESVIGLGDGGAHYGMICDSTYPTFMLTHWTRERSGSRLSLPEAVAMLTTEPAAMVGLGDRGRIAPGYKADLNVIDYERLRLEPPSVRHDLPGGGRRIMQAASGYCYTIVSGAPIVEDDTFTDRLPGRLVRGTRLRAAAQR